MTFPHLRSVLTAASGTWSEGHRLQTSSWLPGCMQVEQSDFAAIGTGKICSDHLCHYNPLLRRANKCSNFLCLPILKILCVAIIFYNYVRESRNKQYVICKTTLDCYGGECEKCRYY